MPKSKKRKGRYTPRPPRVQQTGAMVGAAPAPAGATVDPVAAPRPAAPAPRPATTPARAPSVNPKAPVMQQVNISTELKVIGILTLALLALVVVLYFVLR